MGAHATFRFPTLASMEAKAAELGVQLPFEPEINALSRPWTSGKWSAPNRLAIHPMEGQDGLEDGSPGPLTIRRYRRFAAGGAGLLWFEACAVVPEGRANPRQLWLHDGNVEAFHAMLATARRNVDGPQPLCILQLTHSGRYSRPRGAPEPLVAAENPFLIKPNARVLSDDDLDALQERYLHAAVLAEEAGFDGVDVKSCHGYLANELLGAFTRDGRYGGSYENRTRFITNIVRGMRERLPDLLVTARLNAYDAVPYPYGWGVAEDGDGRIPDLAEPIHLVRELAAMGAPMVNITAGNPYYNPHIGRPFDLPTEALYTPDEHPLEGVARLVDLTRQVQQAVPETACIGTGYSWLRQYFGYAAEAVVRNGWAAFVGVGREAFANPGFARELLTEGRTDPNRVCVACSSCTELMRDGSTTGCVPRDKIAYAGVFCEGRRRKPGARKLPHPIANHI